MIAVVIALSLTAPPRVGPDREPTVQDVQEAVAAGWGDARVDETWKRARWSHALPQRLAVRIRGDDSLSLDGAQSDDGWSVKTSDDDRLSWQVDVQWDLSKIAYDPRADRLLALSEERSRRRVRAVDDATRLYYRRRRLQYEYLALPLDADDRRRALWLDIEELGARLDALTGGLLRNAAVPWWDLRTRPP
jgi:hypothetical protein